MNYYKYSKYLQEIYGEKVYKIPINLPLSCPNRDGNCGTGGCTYCGDDGAGHEADVNLSVREQVIYNSKYIGEKYKAKKFISYFLNFSNTYLPLANFKENVENSIIENTVEIAISTRPDCINKEYLDVLKEISNKYSVKITIELGLQSVNHRTLTKINRSHTLAEFIESSILIKSYGFYLCTHIILNLPYDDMNDTIECSKILSALGVDFVKLHSLYIVKNTIMADEYISGDLEICSAQEYKRRVITFLQYLDPNIKIERLIGRAPKDIVLFENWGTSWWKIRDEIEFEMQKGNVFQGDKFNYLGGSALGVFNKD